MAQRGKNGSYTVANANEWLNTYTHLINDANIGATEIIVQDNSLSGAIFTNNLEAGDLILIIQQQGASLDVETLLGPTSGYTAQTSWSGFGQGGTEPDWLQNEFGQIVNYNNAGNFEMVEVAGTTGAGQIDLVCELTKNYTASGHVQVVRVPRFQNLIIPNNLSVSCPLWNGEDGGIVAIEVLGNLELQGNSVISAIGRGFRGGELNSLSAVTGDLNSQGFLGAVDPIEGAENGESIGGYHAEYDALFSRYGRGALANGGGGGNYHNAGGGGGSNVGVGTFTGKGVPDPGPNGEYIPAWDLEDPNMLTNPSSGGGRGGYSHATQNNDPLTLGPNDAAWGADNRRVTGGVGGHALTLNTDKLFMGGGGGAGDDNDDMGGAGGRGGGIVFLTVYGEISGTGSVDVNGDVGGDATGPAPPPFSSQKTGDDGAGGGGGGGSIYIQNNLPIPNSISLNANGGAGGDQNIQLGALATPNFEGPGGGGAGGMIAFSVGTPNQSVDGGLGGTTNSALVSNFPYNGATGGAAGIDNVVAPFFDIIVEDDTLCGGGTTTLVANVVGAIPSGDVQWYDAPIGGNLIHTGNSFTTPALTANTTYYVGFCPGTFREEVTVFVSPQIEIDGPPIVSHETCAGNDGSITGLTVTGGAGVLTYEWNGQSTATPNLSGVVGGSYTLVVTDENGCTETEGPIVINAFPGPTIDTANMVITPETCLGDDGAITGIVASGSGVTFEWNGQSASSTDLTDVSGGGYTLVVTDDQGCSSAVGPINVPTVAGPVIDSSNLVITDESCAENDGAINGITASGSGLSFTWNGAAASSADTTGLIAGSYELEVTDENGCSSTAGPFVIQQVGGPIIDDAAVIITDDLCGQGVGGITGINVSGDVASWEWNGNAATGSDLQNITEGSYTLVVTDINGCSSTGGPYNVLDTPGPEIDTSNLVIQDESCLGDDGSISGISVTGNNVVYAWNNQVSTSLDLNDLSAGSYTLDVADENGCIASAGPFTIDFVPGPSIDDAQLNVTNESCDGLDGEITGLQVEGNNLSFEWNGEVADLDLTGVGAGNYTLTVTDENGCVSTYGPVNIGQDVPGSAEASAIPVTIFAGDESQINTNYSPGGNIQNIDWNPENDLSCSDCLNPIANPDETTIYTITIIDEFNCVTTDTVLINVLSPCETVVVPTIFSPNGDGKNDFFCILDECLASGMIQVFSRWGELVFETSDIEQCWDGTHKGEDVNSGVFVYQIEGRLVSGENIVVSGNVTVLR